ncbi:hypothetical protein CN918_32410 [Priestia megaterium]|nr:hypothetical protein CN918_32410 [Priestia megaterium]
MYSYEFNIKKDTVYFKGIDEKFIAMDKEDMVHVLSAIGHWTISDNNIYLNSATLKRKVSLPEYIMNYPRGYIRHLNGNYLDCRKRNLAIIPPQSLGCYIRSWNSLAAYKNLDTLSTESQKHFVITAFQKITGYFFLFPLTNRHYSQLSNSQLTSFESYASNYENDTSYHHFLIGYNILDKKTLHSFSSFYYRFFKHLQLRNITIQSIITPRNTPTSELLLSFARENGSSIKSLRQSNNFHHLEFINY